MPQLAIAAVGAVIGSAAPFAAGLFGVSGAAIGWSIGSVVGSLLFAPDGARASLQDTRAAKLQFGSKMPRVFGRARMPLNPRWQSDWRATSQEAGGKGGGGSEYFTYSADGLFWVADGDNVLTGVRIWHNGELVWSSLSDSDADTLAASAAQPLWSAITFWPGTSAQMPWPVYEAAVGSANADAHRGMFCVSIENYQAGQSPNWGLLEVEVITQGTQSVGGALTRLQSYFTANDSDDISAYLLGAPTAPTGYASITGDAFTYTGPIGNSSGSGGYIGWTAAELGGTYGGPVLVEALVNITTATNTQALSPLFTFLQNSGDTGTRHDFCLAYTAGANYFAYNNAASGIESISGVLGSGVHHIAMQFGPSGAMIAIDGAVFYYTAADATPTAGTTGFVRLGMDAHSQSSGQLDYTITAFRFRGEEVYDVSGFTPPTEIDPPDGTTDVWTPDTEDLADIAEAECTRCGLAAGQQDHAELVGTEVTGVVFSGSGRDAMETLAAAYYFGATCRDAIITRVRGAASVATVPFDDSGAAIDQAGEPFTGVTRGNDQEVPAYWVVSSPDLSNNYETGTEESGRAVTTSVERRQAQLPVVFTPAERKGRAIALALDAAVSSHTCGVSLADTYARLEPFDVVTLTDEEGNTYRVRLVRENYAHGVKAFEGVLDDVAALPTTGATSAPYTPTIVVAPAGTVDGILLDGPIARDADDDHGFYWVTDFADGATAASLLRSTDDVSFANLTNSSADAVTGAALTALAAWAGGYLVDETSTVRVVLSGALTAATDAAILEDETTNAFALGAHGRWEYGQFKTPTLVSSGGGTYTYDLTGLLRGRRGSEAAMSTHAAGDTFILLRLAGMRRATLDSGEVGLTRYYKSVPAGVLSSSVASESFVNAAVGRMPYSPVDCNVAFDGSDNATITWLRRSRLACRFVGTGGINCPLGEASEAYEVDVYADNTFAAVVRTISATTQTASYTAAQQTTDGLTPGDPLNLRIYQLSETVGRGYALEEAAP